MAPPALGHSAVSPDPDTFAARQPLRPILPAATARCKRLRRPTPRFTTRQTDSADLQPTGPGIPTNYNRPPPPSIARSPDRMSQRHPRAPRRQPLAAGARRISPANGAVPLPTPPLPRAGRAPIVRAQRLSRACGIPPRARQAAIPMNHSRIPPAPRAKRMTRHSARRNAQRSKTQIRSDSKNSFRVFPRENPISKIRCCARRAPRAQHPR